MMFRKQLKGFGGRNASESGVEKSWLFLVSQLNQTVWLTSQGGKTFPSQL